MKPRRIYYRRKQGNIIIEGRSKKKTEHIKTLPKDPLKLLEIMRKASYIPEEKFQNIMEKINRLEPKAERRVKGSPKVRTTVIVRTPERDGLK